LIRITLALEYPEREVDGWQHTPTRERGKIYELVRMAVVGKRPVAADYHGYQRLLCPHRLGWNQQGRARVLCYQFGGGSQSGLKPAGSPANWRCIAVENLQHVELLEGPWCSAPNHSRPQTCIAEVDVDAEDQPERDPQNGQ